MNYDDDQWEYQERPLNDEEFDRIQKRIKILKYLADMAEDQLRTVNLLAAKAKETKNYYWVKRFKEVKIEYDEKKKLSLKEYKDLGGVNFPKEDME